MADKYIVYIKNEVFPKSIQTKSLFDVTNRPEENYINYELFEETELDTDTILNIDKHECPICCTQVPNTHAKEHIASVKHQTFTKVMHIALERIKNNLTHTFKHKSITLNITDTYFCECCCLLVELKDKIKHERTQNHKNNSISDFLMTMLLKILSNSTEEGDFDLIVEYLNKKNDFSAPFVKKSSEIDLQNNDKIDIKNEKKNDALSATAKDSNVESIRKSAANILDSHSEHRAKNSFDILAEYIAHVRTVNVTFDVTALCVDRVRIVTNSGEAIAVPLRHFHGFSKRKKKILYCNVCQKKIFKDSRSINHHSMSFEHIENITRKLEDKHCLRKIDDINIHCVICNIVIKNVVNHMTKSTHLKYLSNYVIIDKPQNQRQKAIPSDSDRKAISSDSDRSIDQAMSPDSDKSIDVTAKANKCDNFTSTEYANIFNYPHQQSKFNYVAYNPYIPACPPNYMMVNNSPYRGGNLNGNQGPLMFYPPNTPDQATLNYFESLNRGALLVYNYMTMASQNKQ